MRRDSNIDAERFMYLLNGYSGEIAKPLGTRASRQQILKCRQDARVSAKPEVLQFPLWLLFTGLTVDIGVCTGCMVYGKNHIKEREHANGAGSFAQPHVGRYERFKFQGV